MIADCEWALGGGTERMAAEAFHDWIFDVLEAWASEGETALVNLGTELLEGVTVPARHRQRPVGADASSVAAYELLPVSEVEWNGLLRFRDPSAPPNTLNWAQARRLVHMKWRVDVTMYTNKMLRVRKPSLLLQFHHLDHL